MTSEKSFRAAIIILAALFIVIYGVVNRYQFLIHEEEKAGFVIVTGYACDRFTGKCEWLSQYEMGLQKEIDFYKATETAKID